MRIYSFILLILSIASLSAGYVKRCEFSVQNLQQQAEFLMQDFDQGEFHRVVADVVFMNRFIEPLQDDCPVLYNEEEKTEYQAPIDCLKNIHKLKEIFEGDVVSKYQEIKDIFSFQSSQCSPNDYMYQGFQKTIDGIISKDSEQNESEPTTCMGCSIILTAVINYIDVNKLDITEFIGKKGICRILPGLLEKSCDHFFDKYGPMILEALLKRQDSDQICDSIGFCNGWTQCKLHGQNQPKPLKLKDSKITKQITTMADLILPGWLERLKEKIVKEHLPIFDIDGDKFSTKDYLRGWDWRGKDCAPYNNLIYPGRAFRSGKKGTDFNCNGIHGYDSATGIPYEHKYCADSKNMGSITIGDSAGAHFSLPSKYFNSTLWNKGTLHDFIPRLFNEFDIPQESAGTGFESSVGGNSFYLKMLERNRCNKNDYQNIAVNGASSVNVMDYMLAIARDQKFDQPALIFWELIGNDVCGKSADLADLTQPDEFRKNILNLWNKLDTLLPKGSHMVVTGLGDGQILFECLKDRKQPLGVTYTQLYDYMNCMHSSPCAGWMNSDAEIRARTTNRARELNQQYKDIIASTKWKNFDVQYYDFPLAQILKTAEEKGGHCWDAIEPVDGFHPSGVAEKIWADILWENLERDHPDWLGPINPYNDQIKEQFGEQSIKVDYEQEGEDVIELQ